MGFSGGSYEEVARWLWNFLTSHVKRVDPRIEVLLDAGDDRHETSYGVRFRLGSEVSPVMELEYKDVADHRGDLAWGRALADRTREFARTHLLHAATAAPR